MFYKHVSLNAKTQQVKRDFDKQEAFIASAWVVVFVLCNKIAILELCRKVAT